MNRLWRITGRQRGKLYTFKLRALDHNEAVRRASQMRYVVEACVLLDEFDSRAAAIAAYALLTGAPMESVI